jgi:hypothetical protein
MTASGPDAGECIMEKREKNDRAWGELLASYQMDSRYQEDITVILRARRSFRIL